MPTHRQAFERFVREPRHFHKDSEKAATERSFSNFFRMGAKSLKELGPCVRNLSRIEVAGGKGIAEWR